MIKLDVDKFCENCDEFEPYVSIERLQSYSDPSFMSVNSVIVNTAITCKHRVRCRSIKRYLTTAKEE